MTLAPPRPITTTITRGPNWYASVMGTGIVATAAVSLPVHVPGLRAVATVVWAGAAILLVAVALLVGRQRIGDDPVMMHFWGAPPMALLTVGAGALLLGRDVLGEPVAVALSAVLWTAGTVSGLVVAVVVTCRRLTMENTQPFGGWLMPVVPPMVSAATAALLVPYAPVGLRLDLLLACYAMAGAALVAALLIIARLFQVEARNTPTQWIVLGPLGQSVTALHLLGIAADGVLPEPYANAAATVAVLYGVPMLGFALFWLAVAATVTVRTARAGLPFAMTWWSFTFPVGTLVTAASGLAVRTGSVATTGLALVLYAFLVVAWLVVGARTARGYLTGVL